MQTIAQIYTKILSCKQDETPKAELDSPKK